MTTDHTVTRVGKIGDQIIPFRAIWTTLLFIKADCSPERHATMNFFQGQTMNPTLSPLLAYPTELTNHVLSLPLIPGSTLPFNLLITLNAIRLNLEYSKAQHGVERGYLQVIFMKTALTFRAC